MLGAWLLRSGRVTAGTIFVGLLCLVEVAGVPTYTRHNAGDWVFQISYGLVSLAGLIGAIALLAGRRRLSSSGRARLPWPGLAIAEHQR